MKQSIKQCTFWFLLIWLLFQPQFLRWAEEGLCIRRHVFFALLSPQGANYGAEIKHHQLFMQEFHPPKLKGIGGADTNFLMINATQKQEKWWLTAPAQLWIRAVDATRVSPRLSVELCFWLYKRGFLPSLCWLRGACGAVCGSWL